MAGSAAAAAAVVDFVDFYVAVPLPLVLDGPW